MAIVRTNKIENGVIVSSTVDEINISDLVADRKRYARKPIGDESQFPPKEQIVRELRRGCCDRPR